MNRFCYFFAYAFLLFFLSSCNTQETPENSEEKAKFLQEAENIALASQKAFLTKVTRAIEGGGSEYAVDFCNLAAIPLTDSLSEEFGVLISRISDKNRNPGNNLDTKSDKEAWEYFLQQKDAVSFEATETGNMVVYKPIKLGMPACLECHGQPDSDILPQTLAKIREKYPEDLAIGYELGMLRGMWKIEKPSAER